VRSLLRRILRLEKEEAKKKEVREKPVDRNFYFIFQSADGSLKIKHGIRRSELPKVVEQLKICLKDPKAASLTMVVGSCTK
jgi:hypothetical protein